MWLHVFGRLKPGVTLAQAEVESNAIFHVGLESFYGPGTSSASRRDLLDQRLTLQSGARGASPNRAEFSQSLSALLAAIALLLLITSANLAVSCSRAAPAGNWNWRCAFRSVRRARA